MAAEQTIRVVQIVQTLIGNGIAAVGNEAVGVQQTGRTDEFVGIPPERRTGGRTTGAQNTFVQAVQLFALFLSLQTLFVGIDRIVVDDVRLNGVVLFEELGHVHNQVADDRQTGQRADFNRLFQATQIGQTCQAVFAVDIHTVRTANTFTARTAERQCIVLCFQTH